MRKVLELPEITLEELDSRIKGLPSKLYLLKADGTRIMLIDGVGKRFPLVNTLPRVLSKVELYELDKFEFLDLLNSPSPEPVPPSSPNSVTFSYSTGFSDLPPSAALKIESTVQRIVKRAYSRGIAIESLELSGSLRQGVTGRDILRITAKVSAYTVLESPGDELRRIASEILSRETGFETRVLVRGEFKRVTKLPSVKVDVSGFTFRGGEIVEISLRGGSQGSERLKVNRSALEMEVERMLKEAGIDKIAENIKSTKSSEGISLRKAASVIRDSLRSLKGLALLDVGLMPGLNGHKVVVRVKKEGKDSTSAITSMVSEALKSSQGRLRALGLPIELEKAYLIIEE
ncbi:hypothetical protein A3L09_09885 [Thermococcus profundus]|uniref:Uncharacterized protein n=1 Tax=Thermococcus profundus TaxID=49899 RepID=A0A2Z2MFM7_THEPR|nr:hypothetical protein [Thermococcus profundus]ASJ03542.1 hypothetical protein A3L09_09885 [Thermococcus profundus]